jgi:hypothetical protein
MTIAKNILDIRTQISAAATKADRDPSLVKLVAVSKTHPVSKIKEAAAEGQVDFGENRPQDMLEKYEQLPDLQWHMIGSLQRNKVKYIAPFVHLIHSVDSEKLLKEINKRAGQNERNIDCLLQINISDEDQKGGLTENEAHDLLNRIEEYPHIRVLGLMGMAEFTSDMKVVRMQFRRLKTAYERFKVVQNERVSMQQLSMGMSGDFEVAIEEGATLVRIGSAIFGHR